MSAAMVLLKQPYDVVMAMPSPRRKRFLDAAVEREKKKQQQQEAEASRMRARKR